MRIKRKIKRKKRRKSRSFIVPFLLFALISTGIIFFLNSDYFSIKNISVEGAYSVSNETVLETCKITVGENIFAFKAKNAENLIKTISVVKNVSVIRQYPNSIKIIITERVPFVTIFTKNKYYSLDDTGMVLSETDKLNNTQSIVLSGITDIQLNISEIYDINSNVNVLTAYEVATWLRTQGLLEKVSEIYVSPSGYYYMYTRNTNVIKFYALSSFQANEEFIKEFLMNEKRSIMIEVVEDSEPVYKIINVN